MASIRSARRRDLLWAFGGGGLLALYAIAIVFTRIEARAEMVREMDWIWFAALPIALLATGFLTGVTFARIAQKRAYAPFLKVQPITAEHRRRMASKAAIRLGIPLIVIDGGLIFVGATAAGMPLALAWGIGAALVSGAEFLAAVRWRLNRPPPKSRSAVTGAASNPISVSWIDRNRPAWLGSWASGFTGGRVRLTLRGSVVALLFGLFALGAGTASIVRENATPAILGGVVGGLALFMLLLRCRPLLSPILRASSLRFTAAIRGLVRLPLLVSVLFFGALAVPAYAAEPATLAIPISGAIGLLTLNGIYTVFAAFFAHSRRLAALSFSAALALAAYESLEYGRSVLLALAALTVFLWLRARKAYRNG